MWDKIQANAFRLNLSIPVAKLLARLKLDEYRETVQHYLNIINFNTVTEIKQWAVITAMTSTNEVCVFKKICTLVPNELLTEANK